MLQFLQLFFFNLASGFNLNSTAPQPIKLTDFLTLRENNGETKNISQVYNNPSVFVNLFVSNVFVLAGVIIFFMIIGAGLSYLKDTDKGKDDAKNLATGAVTGFLVMFGAYWIVQIIKLVTGADIPIAGPGPMLN